MLNAAHAQDKDERLNVEILLQFTKAYNKAWHNMNLEHITAFHDEGLVYYLNGRLMTSTKTAFEEMFTRYIKPEIKTYSSEMINPKITLLGPDAASVGFEFKGNKTTADNETKDIRGAVTLVFKKVNTAWWLILMHESSLKN